jgi:CRP/FNR family transcriptional regulator, cyclic AMP receptor protein
LGEVNRDGESRIPIRLSQNDLAALVGATRVRVTQIIVGYKRREYIGIDGDLRATFGSRS